MLRRKVTDRLLSWKNDSDKALLVTGARQIGKSYAIRAFGKDNYASYFEVNLLLDAEARDVLVGAKNSVDFINRVALLADTPLVEGDTLIFVDEIQEYPQIVTLMKALVEDLTPKVHPNLKRPGFLYGLHQTTHLQMHLHRISEDRQYFLLRQCTSPEYPVQTGWQLQYLPWQFRPAW